MNWIATVSYNVCFQQTPFLYTDVLIVCFLEQTWRNHLPSSSPKPVNPQNHSVYRCVVTWSYLSHDGALRGLSGSVPCSIYFIQVCYHHPFDDCFFLSWHVQSLDVRISKELLYFWYAGGPSIICEEWKACKSLRKHTPIFHLPRKIVYGEIHPRFTYI